MEHEFPHRAHVFGNLERFLVEPEQISKRRKVKYLDHAAEFSAPCPRFANLRLLTGVE